MNAGGKATTTKPHVWGDLQPQKINGRGRPDSLSVVPFVSLFCVAKSGGIKNLGRDGEDQRRVSLLLCQNKQEKKRGGRCTLQYSKVYVKVEWRTMKEKVNGAQRLHVFHKPPQITLWGVL